MATYAYRGRSHAGEAVEGRIEGASREGVASELSRLGIVPLRIDETRSAVEHDYLKELRTWWRLRSIKLDDLSMFSRQMYTLTRAGLPITRTLRGLADSSRNLQFKEILGDLASQLEGGHELATAMQQHPRVFSSLFVSMVHIGESVGQLEESFQQLYGYLELEGETRKRIKSATRYPSMVIIAMVIAIGIINVFVIPPFARLFDKLGAELPWATRLLLGTSEYSIRYWPHLLVLVVLGVIAFRRWVDSDAGGVQWDRLKLRMPVVGSLLDRALMARFARTLAVTLGAGLAVSPALTVVARAVDNRFVARKILEMLEAIERGDTLTASAHSSGMFTPLVLQMLSVGEETGSVDDTLVDVAEYYEREVDYDLKRLSDAIEPILIIAMGALVLLLALGVYLPMWDMASAARG